MSNSKIITNYISIDEKVNKNGYNSQNENLKEYEMIKSNSEENNNKILNEQIENLRIKIDYKEEMLDKEKNNNLNLNKINESLEKK